MKTKLLLLAFTVLSAGAYCQSKNSLCFVVGTAGNGIFLIGIGGAGYQGKGETIYGLNYSRSLTKSFSIETGLEYSLNNVLLDYVDPPRPSFKPQDASIRMLSVPVYAKITFLKYLFADGGLIADFETDHHSDAIVSDQSGIGIGLGIGGKYNFKKMFIFINPFLQFHSIISFRNEGNGSLVDQGVKVGIGYLF
ncbi:MAG TPA: outer membrane beta-barrel protein [Mucilaginibacter sp.]|jgi:hypothetical protein